MSRCSKWSRKLCRPLLVVASAMSFAARGHAADDSLTGRVRLVSLNDVDAVRQALRGVRQRLQGAECRTVFSDFRDASGRSLRAKLEELGVTEEEYLARVFYFDPRPGETTCERAPVMAFTAPGEPVVRICQQFALQQRRTPRYAEVVLLHEILHTLGLGENPPSSREITAAIMERCGR